MNQHVEDKQWAPTPAPTRAPTKSTTQQTKHSNFLKDTTFGIMMSNIISQYLYSVSNFLLQILSYRLEPVLTTIIGTWLGTTYWCWVKNLFQRKERAARERDLEMGLQDLGGKLDELNRAFTSASPESLGRTSEPSTSARCPTQPNGFMPGALPSNEGPKTAHSDVQSIPEAPANQDGAPEVHHVEPWRVILTAFLTQKGVPDWKVTGLLQKKYGGQDDEMEFRVLPGSRIVEARLSTNLDGDFLRKARNVVEEGAMIDKDFTLQIEDWGIYYCAQDDSTGVLCIYGLHLEGADIKVATSSTSKKLVTVTHEKICGGKFDMLSCKDLLPATNLQNLHVYAIKPTLINEGGRKVNVMSSSAKIKDIHVKRALREWLPGTLTVIFVARQLWLLAKPVWIALSASESEVYWSLPILLIIIHTLLVLPRTATEEWITEKLRSLCFAYSRLRVYLSSLRSLELDMPGIQKKSESGINEQLSNSGFKSKGNGAQSGTPLEGEALEVGGETIQVTPLDWKWESLDLVKIEGGKLVETQRPLVKPDARDSAGLIPFRVIYDLSSEAPWPDQLYVHIKSSALLETIQKLLPNVVQARIHSECDSIGIRGRELFVALDKLKTELQRVEAMIGTLSDGVRTIYQEWRELNHLIQLLAIQYADVPSRFNRMDQEARVSWDMLWTFLRPGEEAVYSDMHSGEEVCGLVKGVSYKAERDRMDRIRDGLRKWKLHVRLEVYNYNCKTFSEYGFTRQIPSFEGEIAFQALGVRPLRFVEEPEASEKHLLQRGSTFGYLSTIIKCRHMYYTGIMFRYVMVKDDLRLVREMANGRVMVDLASHRKMNPDYPLGNAAPPSEVIRDNKIVQIDISEEPNRKYAPCIVYGFSFRLKKWGAFSVCGFSKVEYNNNAWDEVVMDHNLKEMTEVLVGEHLRTAVLPDSFQRSGLDTISNKGESCIVLCYGPPGTGKTLTAEALADKQKAPLWAMSVSELGITPSELEAELVSVFEVAHSWHALLLLDEADVYLERRSDGVNLERNAMTGIFLRQLEYYKCVLFLTTNRESRFDEAFSSRISLFLPYKALDRSQRKLIWKNFLHHAGVNIAADENVDSLLSTVSFVQLNGRQIRNVIQNAMKLASQLGSKTLSGKLLLKAAENMVGPADHERSSSVRRSWQALLEEVELTTQITRDAPSLEQPLLTDLFVGEDKASVRSLQSGDSGPSSLITLSENAGEQRLEPE